MNRRILSILAGAALATVPFISAANANVLFNFVGAGTGPLTVDGITATPTATGGTLENGNGYGVDGNGTGELNFDEILKITFDQLVQVRTIEYRNSDGGNNDLVKLVVDGIEFDHFAAFGSNHPEEIVTCVPDQVCLLDYSPYNVVGKVFEFSIPAGSQAQGNDGSEYRVGAMDVKPVSEPASMALLGLGLAGLGVIRRRRTSA